MNETLDQSDGRTKRIENLLEMSLQLVNSIEDLYKSSYTTDESRKTHTTELRSIFIRDFFGNI